MSQIITVDRLVRRIGDTVHVELPERVAMLGADIVDIAFVDNRVRVCVEIKQPGDRLDGEEVTVGSGSVYAAPVTVPVLLGEW
jgi:hypothetical protein